MGGRIIATEEERGDGAPVEPVGIEVERHISPKLRNKPLLHGMKPTNKKMP